MAVALGCSSCGGVDAGLEYSWRSICGACSADEYCGGWAAGDLYYSV